MKRIHQRAFLVMMWMALALLPAACGGGGGSDNVAAPAADSPAPSPPDSPTYTLSVIAMEARESATGQSVAIEGLPLSGNTATVQ